MQGNSFNERADLKFAEQIAGKGNGSFAMEVGDEFWVFNEDCSLKSERASQNRLSAWLTLQLCICPGGQAKAIACLALVYEQAYMGCIWHLSKVLGRIQREPERLRQCNSATFLRPLADAPYRKLWKKCKSMLTRNGDANPVAHAIWAGKRQCIELESYASLKMLADTFGQMSFPYLRKKRRGRHGYLKNSYPWAGAVQRRTLKLECESEDVQYKACRAVFQWQVIWSALVHPPRLPLVQNMCSGLASTHLAQLAAIIAITGRKFDEPLPAAALASLTNPHEGLCSMTLPLIVERIRSVSEAKTSNSNLIKAGVELFSVIQTFTFKHAEIWFPMGIINYLIAHALDAIAFLCSRSPQHMLNLRAMGLFRMMLDSKRPADNDVSEHAHQQYNDMTMRLIKVGMADVVTSLFHKTVKVEWTTLSSLQRKRHISNATDLLDLVGRIIITGFAQLEPGLSLYRSVHELLRQIGAFVQLRKNVKLPDPKGRNSLKKGFFNKRADTPVKFDDGFRSLIATVFFYLRSMTYSLQEQHWPHEQIMMAPMKAAGPRPVMDSTELALAEIESLISPDFLPEPSQEDVGDTLNRFLTTSFAKWRWQDYMRLYGMMPLSSKIMELEPIFLQAVVDQLSTSLQEIASTEKAALPRYVHPYRPLLAGNVPAVFHAQPAMLFKILYFNAIGKFLTASSAGCRAEEKWLWEKDIPAMTKYVAAMPKGFPQGTGLSVAVCMEFMWQMHTFTVKADLVLELADTVLGCYADFMSTGLTHVETMVDLQKHVAIDRDLFLIHFARKCEEARRTNVRPVGSRMLSPAREYGLNTIEIALRLIRAKLKAPLQEKMDPDSCLLSMQVVNRAVQVTRILDQNGWEPVILTPDFHVLVDGFKFVWLWRLKLWYLGVLSPEKCAEYDDELTGLLCNWIPFSKIAENGEEKLQELEVVTRSYVDAVSMLCKCCNPKFGTSKAAFKKAALAEFKQWQSFPKLREEIAKVKSRPPQANQTQRSQSERQELNSQDEAEAPRPTWYHRQTELLRRSSAWGLHGSRGNGSTADVAPAAIKAGVRKSSTAPTQGEKASTVQQSARNDTDSGVANVSKEVEALLKKKSLLQALRKSRRMKCLQAICDRQDGHIAGLTQALGGIESEASDVLVQMIAYEPYGREQQAQEFLFYMRFNISEEVYKEVGAILVCLQAGAFRQVFMHLDSHTEQFGERLAVKIFNDLMAIEFCDYWTFKSGIPMARLRQLPELFAKELIEAYMRDGTIPRSEMIRKAKESHKAAHQSKPPSCPQMSPQGPAEGIQIPRAQLDFDTMAFRIRSHSKYLLSLEMMKTLQAVRDRGRRSETTMEELNSSNPPIQPDILTELLYAVQADSHGLSKLLQKLREEIVEEEYEVVGSLLNWVEGGKFMQFMDYLISTGPETQSGDRNLVSTFIEPMRSFFEVPLLDFQTWKANTNTLAPESAQQTSLATKEWATAMHGSHKEMQELQEEKLKMDQEQARLLAENQKLLLARAAQATKSALKPAMRATQECPAEQASRAISGSESARPTSSSGRIAGGEDFKPAVSEAFPDVSEDQQSDEYSDIEPAEPVARKETPALARLRKRLAAQKAKEVQQDESKASQSGGKKGQKPAETARTLSEKQLAAQRAEEMFQELLQEEAQEKDKLAKAAAKREKKKKQQLKRREKNDGAVDSSETIVTPPETEAPAPAAVEEATESSLDQNLHAPHNLDVIPDDSPDAFSQTSPYAVLGEKESQQALDSRTQSRSKPSAKVLPIPSTAARERINLRSGQKPVVEAKKAKANASIQRSVKALEHRSHNALAGPKVPPPNNRSKEDSRQGSLPANLQRPVPPGRNQPTSGSRLSEDGKHRQTQKHAFDIRTAPHHSMSPPGFEQHHKYQENTHKFLAGKSIPPSRPSPGSRQPIAKDHPTSGPRKVAGVDVQAYQQHKARRSEQDLQAPLNEGASSSRASLVESQQGLERPSSSTTVAASKTVKSSRPSNARDHEVEKEQSRQDKWQEMEDYCVCPITQEVMKDPVLAQDGYTYERSAIALWLQNHDTSPMTNEKLRSKELSPNRIIKKMIQDALAAGFVMS